MNQSYVISGARGILIKTKDVSGVGSCTCLFMVLKYHSRFMDVVMNTSFINLLLVCDSCLLPSSHFELASDVFPEFIATGTRTNAALA